MRTKEFLSFGDEAKAQFIGSTIWTASVIATQIEQSMADCIADWYTDDPATVKQRNAEILNIMADYPDSYPTGIVVAVIQKQCGKFGG